MKKTLLSALLITAAGASAQTTVDSFYPLNNAATGYFLLDAEDGLDESPTGADAEYGFTGLSSYGNTQTTVNPPTEDQLTMYPGTTSVVETTGDFDTTQFFLATGTNGQVQVTGATAGSMMLNYSTNNLNLGVFPMSFEGTATEDEVAGTYSAMDITGTFSGTSVSSVDAYGSMYGVVVSDMPVVTLVTRHRVVQDLDLYVTGIPIPVGTLTQEMNSYFNDALEGRPIFRTVTITINVPTLNQTQQSIESYYDPTAGVEDFNKIKFVVAPNPVNDVLHFDGNALIKNITVTDTAGRQVLQYNGNDANVSGLTAGVYIVSAQTEAGAFTQKIVKQ